MQQNGCNCARPPGVLAGEQNVKKYRAGVPQLFDLALPPLILEAGANLTHHIVRGFHWGPQPDTHTLQQRCPSVQVSTDTPALPTRRSSHDLDLLQRAKPGVDAPWVDVVPNVLVIHTLTGDARAGGPGGFWAPVIGPGEPLDPERMRIFSFNVLGSCYGTSGPTDASFPHRTDDVRFTPTAGLGRGGIALPEPHLPATVTTWDQARSILLALDALGIHHVDLALGGSLGGMIVLCLAALDPTRFSRILPIAAVEAASSWILAWNHIGRQAILADPGFPHEVRRGLELARQIAMVTFRSELIFDASQGRLMAEEHDDSSVVPWSSRLPYRMQTYLEYQGSKFRNRFDAQSYLCLLDAMDHHDLSRRPSAPTTNETWPWKARDQGWSEPPSRVGHSWGLSRIRASALGVGVDSDQLYRPEQTDDWVERLKKQGVVAERAMLQSPYGHDAILLEWDQIRQVIRQAWQLPSS